MKPEWIKRKRRSIATLRSVKGGIDMLSVLIGDWRRALIEYLEEELGDYIEEV